MINSFSIVIPSYNESENINEIYRRSIEVIKKLNIKKYEIIFVENGSKDNSLELLKKIKVFCGTGGTLIDSNIQLQGDMVSKSIEFLRKEGFHNL